MSRITPRRVVEIIERTFPWTKEPGAAKLLTSAQALQLEMVVELIEFIPPELLPTDGDDAIAFAGSVATVRGAIRSWTGQSQQFEGHPIGTLPAFGNRSPLAIIHDTLSKCADQAPSPGTHDLAFVRDDNLRATLRLDLSSARLSLNRGEWKAATVLAGAVVEALLLDAIAAVDQAQIDAAYASWKASTKRRSDAKASKELARERDRWSLSELLWIAHHAGVISEGAAAAVDVARDFRNLIHPGKLRIAAPADEGTAFAALGAALRVASELEARRG